MLLTSATASAAIDLSNLSDDPITGRQEYTQVFEGRTSPYDWTRIAFDYDFQNVGDHVPDLTAGEIQIKRYDYADATAHWMMEMRFDSTGTTFTVDTDYGPYIYTAATTGGLKGLHSYEFMLNRSNGLWTMAIGGSELTFQATASTNTTQPDGTAVVVGADVASKYVSDESYTSYENAVRLGWATVGTPPDHLDGDASDGVGGVGDWKLYFAEASGNSVDGITMAECSRAGHHHRMVPAGPDCGRPRPVAAEAGGVIPRAKPETSKGPPSRAAFFVPRSGVGGMRRGSHGLFEIALLNRPKRGGLRVLSIFSRGKCQDSGSGGLWGHRRWLLVLFAINAASVYAGTIALNRSGTQTTKRPAEGQGRMG